MTERKVVLFVDDEQAFLENLELLLSDDPEIEGHYLTDPEAALQVAMDLKPHAIFLDVSMPKMDGGELAIALRENPVTTDIPIVFLTAIVTEAERGSHGGQIFLPKPIQSEGIKQVLEDLLRTS